MAQFSPRPKMLPEDFLDALKFEVADELGIPLREGYNGDITARAAGAIGGKIGGNMVRVMVRYAQQMLTNQGQLPPG